MRISSKIALGIMATTAVIGANGQKNSKVFSLNLPSGEERICGYAYDFSYETNYRADIDMEWNEKYVSAWIGDVTVSVAKTNKWLAENPADNCTVWTFEIVKDEDDAWFTIEFGM